MDGKPDNVAYICCGNNTNGSPTAKENKTKHLDATRKRKFVGQE